MSKKKVSSKSTSTTKASPKKASKTSNSTKKSSKDGSVSSGLGMVGGAAAGAAAGALFGPVSAAVGAVMGGVAGANARTIAQEYAEVGEDIRQLNDKIRRQDNLLRDGDVQLQNFAKNVFENGVEDLFEIIAKEEIQPKQHGESVCQAKNQVVRQPYGERRMENQTYASSGQHASHSHHL